MSSIIFSCLIGLQGSLQPFPIQFLPPGMREYAAPVSSGTQAATFQSGGPIETVSKRRQLKSIPNTLSGDTWHRKKVATYQTPSVANKNWSALRKSLQSDLDRWMRTDDPGSYTLNISMLTPQFACVHRLIYSEGESPSLGSSRAQVHYYMLSGSKLTRVDFKSLVLPGRERNVSEVFAAALGIRATPELLDIVSIEPGGFRVYWDQDMARGRYINRLINFDQIRHYLRPNSPVAAALKVPMPAIAVSNVPYAMPAPKAFKPVVRGTLRFQMQELRVAAATLRSGYWDYPQNLLRDAHERLASPLSPALRGVFQISKGEIITRDQREFAIWRRGGPDNDVAAATQAGFLRWLPFDDENVIKGGVVARLTQTGGQQLVLIHRKDSRGAGFSQAMDGKLRALIFQDQQGKEVAEYFYNGSHFVFSKMHSFERLDDLKRQEFGQSGFTGHSWSDDLDFDGVAELIVQRRNSFDSSDCLENLILSQKSGGWTPLQFSSWSFPGESGRHLKGDFLCGSLGSLDTVVKNLESWNLEKGPVIAIGSLAKKEMTTSLPGQALLVDDFDGDGDNDIIALRDSKLVWYQQVGN